MKPKSILLLIVIISILACATGCGGSSEFDTEQSINVISREDGSGTRGAFTDIFGLILQGEGGTRKDISTKEAVIAKQTDVLMASITNDKYAIGYISMGSLNDTVKAVAIDGIMPSAATVGSEEYSVVRPFWIFTKENPSELCVDFIDFVTSADGQAVVSQNYIESFRDAAEYSGNKPSGKIVVAGSSSVTPIMEKLKEAYIGVNPGAKIEIQQSDSSAGFTGTVEGTCDIGMASRDLTEDEQVQVNSVKIALDGIVIVVNKNNSVDNLSKQQVKEIFTGEITKWSELS